MPRRGPNSDCRYNEWLWPPPTAQTTYSNMSLGWKRHWMFQNTQVCTHSDWLCKRANYWRSNYLADKVDIISYTSKSKRIVAQIKDFCAILSGLVVAGDYKLGQELFSDRAFSENEEFFQSVFEVGRRYCITTTKKNFMCVSILMTL